MMKLKLYTLAVLVAALYSTSVSAQWSKYESCNRQHNADIAACNKVKNSTKRAVCWSSANERLAYCTKNNGKIGFPALLNK